ncbi:glycerophosphodiester phosphodiesterase [Actinomyces massiliensis]|uniref:glycerophosphodiester phosphodiesterase n=1 Tax=Actinomyces massiliensis TaxID=461393 RepID=UPI000495AD35|nr:glycerophosphodiester phosphodiesterase [Actinomyces massiliensis]WLD70891.1 glycerophosphodiester phosphodiesterase [Actinomyces massiliensis]
MRPRRRCAVIAHRGGAREVPENTWSAVEHVESLGLTWMETDLHATADDVVVLSHDADLGRIGGRGTLSELTWDEAAELDAGDGRGLVRLDEVLEAHPGLALNVDLKEPAVVQPALQVVRAADALDRVRFASFSARRLAMLRRQEPRATTSLGGFDIAGLMLLSEAALPLPHTRWGWTRGRVDAVQVPPMHRGMQVVTRRFVAQAHTAGLEVHVWTIDDPEEMRRLAALNVDAIMTDVPTLALEILGS